MFLTWACQMLDSWGYGTLLCSSVLWIPFAWCRRIPSATAPVSVPCGQGPGSPQSNADIQMQQSQLGYTYIMFSYPNFGALFSIAAWPWIVNKSQYSILCWFCLIACKSLTLEVHLVLLHTASALYGTSGLQLCTSNSAKWKEEVARLL